MENTPNNNTIPITRPQNQKVIQNDNIDFNAIPEQFIEKSKYTTQQINLVSEGLPYPETSPLSSGVIEIKPVTAYQEDILTNQSYIKRGTVLVELLKSLLVDKKIKVEDFLVCDLNGIYISIRRSAYGDSYPIKLKCPSCGVDNDVDVDLSKFQPNLINYDVIKKGINSFEFFLPACKKTITFKLLTQKDDNTIELELKSLSKANKEKSVELSTRLKYIITSVDGEDGMGKIRDFIEKELLSKDSLELRRYIKKITPDVPMVIDFECNSCGASEERMGVPMALSFFWPSA